MCVLAKYCILAGSALIVLALWWFHRSGRLVNVLRKSRDSFKSLVDLSPYGVALTDTNGKIISSNRALAALLGMDVRALKGASFPELLNLDSQDILARASSLGSGEVLKLPLVESTNSQGELCQLRPCLFYDRSQKGLLFWHVQDQTTYLELEKRFEELVESVPVGLFWAENDGKIGATNPEFDKLFSKGEVPSTMKELLGAQAWEEASNSLKRHGDIFKTRIVKEEDDKNKYLKLEIKKCEHGASTYYAGILKDVTVEYELQQQLQEALNEAKAANRAKSSFLSQMSHEFRTPLNVIQGMATILQDKVAKPDALELVADLKKAAEHLTSLIGDILDLAKIESGRLSLEMRPFDLKALLDDLEDVLGVQAHLKDLEFRIKFPDDLHRFYMGDPVRIRQIIFNIAGNGIKLTQNGWVEVAVSQKEGAASGKMRRLELKISDTGPGIPEEILPQLFEPFVQAEDGRKAGGTGLGLSIARQLAEMMNGFIRVESTKGKGSVFTVELELEALDACLVPESALEVADELEPGLALVADDVPMNRKVLRMYLEKKGWKVKEASNGKEVLELLQKEKEVFDVVLMDVSMPEMDGREATRLIKQNEKWKAIPVIAVTAHAMADDRKKLLEAGMDGYVSKPVKPEALWLEMERLLLKEEKGAKVFKGKDEPEEAKGAAAIKNDAKPKIGEAETNRDIPLDYAALVKTCQGMEELAQELLLATLDECPKWLEDARKAVASCDAKEIRRICHLIRGSASTVHAEQLNNAAARLGAAAREGRTEEYLELLKALEEAAVALDNWIRENLSLAQVQQNTEIENFSQNERQKAEAIMA